MSKTIKTYSPTNHTSEPRLFNVNEVDFFVTKEAYNERVNHLEYRINELSEEQKKIPEIVKQQLNDFENNKKSKKSTFRIKVIPIIISVLALLVAVYTAFFK